MHRAAIDLPSPHHINRHPPTPCSHPNHLPPQPLVLSCALIKPHVLSHPRIRPKCRELLGGGGLACRRRRGRRRRRRRRSGGLTHHFLLLFLFCWRRRRRRRQGGASPPTRPSTRGGRRRRRRRKDARRTPGAPASSSSSTTTSSSSTLAAHRAAARTPIVVVRRLGLLLPVLLQARAEGLHLHPARLAAVEPHAHRLAPRRHGLEEHGPFPFQHRVLLDERGEGGIDHDPRALAQGRRRQQLGRRRACSGCCHCVGFASVCVWVGGWVGIIAVEKKIDVCVGGGLG